MKYLYKHVHLVVDNKREYLDGSILINEGIIEDVFVQSNIIIDDAKEIDMGNKIFIPTFFDSKSKKEKQIGVTKKYIASEKILNEPTHFISDDIINDYNNVFAITRINNYDKIKGLKVFINPSYNIIDDIDGVSDITKQTVLNFQDEKIINNVINNKYYIEFGIDITIKDDYINFVLKNIDVNKILLISYEHDDIIEQIKRLRKLNVSLNDIVAMSTINPYKFYGYDKNDGYLVKGKPADIICLNQNMDIEFVLIKGEKNA